MNRLVCAGMFCFLLAGCKSSNNPLGTEPIIDMRGINVLTYEADLQECQKIAEAVQIGKQTAIGAVAGAAIGSVFGAIISDSDAAQRGAGIGAIGGGVKGLSGGLRERSQVVKRCLIGRGYRVLN